MTTTFDHTPDAFGFPPNRYAGVPLKRGIAWVIDVVLIGLISALDVHLSVDADQCGGPALYGLHRRILLSIPHARDWVLLPVVHAIRRLCDLGHAHYGHQFS